MPRLTPKGRAHSANQGAHRTAPRAQGGANTGRSLRNPPPGKQLIQDKTRLSAPLLLSHGRPGHPVLAQPKPPPPYPGLLKRALPTGAGRSLSKALSLSLSSSLPLSLLGLPLHLALLLSPFLCLSLSLSFSLSLSLSLSLPLCLFPSPPPLSLSMAVCLPPSVSISPSISSLLSFKPFVCARMCVSVCVSARACVGSRARAHGCVCVWGCGFDPGGGGVFLGFSQPLSPGIRLPALVPARGKAGPSVNTPAPTPSCPPAGSWSGQATVVGAL